MTAVQPEPVVRANCTRCDQAVPLRPDGLVSWHYLRHKQAGRDSRKRCPGSHHLPRGAQR